MDCSICLESLDGGVAALACGHRFHAACLARLAGATGTSSTRRGALTACPNCRTTSRVAPPVASASFSVGDRVLALWGHKWFPGDVYAVKDGGSAYEIAWDDEDSSNTIPASRVRAAPLTPTPRDARPTAVVTPRAATPPASPMAPAPRELGPPPAPRAIVPRGRSRARAKTSRYTGVRREQENWRRIWRARISVRGSSVDLGAYDDEEGAARAYDAALVKYRNAPTVNFPGEAPLASVLAKLPDAPPPATRPTRTALPPATRRRPHVASTSSAAVCMDLLEAAKDCTNMRGLREPLTSRGFICGAEQRGAVFSVTVPADFPCYYDVVGRGYVNQNRANSLNTLLNYLRGALALVQNGGAYRTEAEYNSRPPGPVAHLAQPAPAPPPPGAPRRSGRAPAPKAPTVIVDPPAPVRRRKRGTDTSQGAKKRKTQSREERRAKQRACRQARRQRKKEEKVARRQRIRAYAEKRKRRRELEDDDAADVDPGATALSTSPSLA